MPWAERKYMGIYIDNQAYPPPPSAGGIGTGETSKERRTCRRLASSGGGFSGEPSGHGAARGAVPRESELVDPAFAMAAIRSLPNASREALDRLSDRHSKVAI
ncbi:hypothetical protein U1Q18_000016 [Sarracenia purpurea var. burkii]